MRSLNILLVTLSVGMGSDVVSQARDHASHLMKQAVPDQSAPNMWVMKQMDAYLLVMSTMIRASSDDILARTV